MLKLVNIKKDDFSISADYYPENQEELRGSVAVHWETGVVIKKDIVPEYESKDEPVYCLLASQALMGLIENKAEIPEVLEVFR